MKNPILIGDVTSHLTKIPPSLGQGAVAFLGFSFGTSCIASAWGTKQLWEWSVKMAEFATNVYTIMHIDTYIHTYIS
jgi:hypothetical protein